MEQCELDLATAQSTWAFAKNFQVAADVLLEKLNANTYTPTLYMLCHSLELSLKAFLLVQGFKEEVLKSSYGHNLNKLLKKAESNKFSDHLNLSNEEKLWINSLNEYYSKKHLEYFVPTAKRFPPIQQFRSLVGKISHAVGEHITGVTFKYISLS